MTREITAYRRCVGVVGRYRNRRRVGRERTGAEELALVRIQDGDVREESLSRGAATVGAVRVVPVGERCAIADAAELIIQLAQTAGEVPGRAQIFGESFDLGRRHRLVALVEAAHVV